jgi:hypothetical protein
MHNHRTPHAGAGGGCGRSSAISHKISWNICRGDGDLGHLEDDIAAVAYDFRADLDQLVLQACQDQSLIGSGVASVRKKLPRL